MARSAGQKHSPALNGKGSLSSRFNAHAKSSHEVEIKFLVPNDDKSVFVDIENYFAARDWILLEKKGSHLLTRQLDTPGRDLLSRGTSLRVRGTCIDNDIDRVETADICVKNGASKDPSGALRRGEYETRIASFKKPDLALLLRKYPKKDYPELHEAVKGVKARDLKEYFRIDCIRDRYVIELPEQDTGLTGKRFVAELILDDVAFVLNLPGRRKPLMFHYDLEIECEALFKPCSYDTHPDAAKHVSTPMSRDESDAGLSAVKRHLLLASPTLLENHMSKAERGFAERQKVMDALKQIVEEESMPLREKFLSRARKYLTAKIILERDDLHKRLQRDYGPVIRRHPLAVHVSAPP